MLVHLYGGCGGGGWLARPLGCVEMGCRIEHAAGENRRVDCEGEM